MALLDSVARRFERRAQEAAAGSARRSAGLELVGDRIRLEQALGNLVENALRYGAGDVGLSASTENGFVQLHVTDEGTGFPPEFLERAFERFTRPDAARSRGGTGLGLSIVRVIAEAHGGVAVATNRAGGGADVGWLCLRARRLEHASRRPSRLSGEDALELVDELESSDRLGLNLLGGARAKPAIVRHAVERGCPSRRLRLEPSAELVATSPEVPRRRL